MWSGEGDWLATGKKQPEKKQAVSEKREGRTHSESLTVALLWGGGVQETKKGWAATEKKKELWVKKVRGLTPGGETQPRRGGKWPVDLWARKRNWSEQKSEQASKLTGGPTGLDTHWAHLWCAIMCTKNSFTYFCLCKLKSFQKRGGREPQIWNCPLLIYWQAFMMCLRLSSLTLFMNWPPALRKACWGLCPQTPAQGHLLMFSILMSI